MMQNLRGLHDRAVYPAIAIIGGGFSGMMVALHLLKWATVPLTIGIIERRSQLGCGLAYSSPLNCHLLNIPARSASLFEEDPDDFWHWATWADPRLRVTPDAFLPRRLFGRYVQSAVQDAAETSVAELVHIQDEAIALQNRGSTVQIELAGGLFIQADCGILALGNLPPRQPDIADPSFYDSPRYISAAWSDWDARRIDPLAPVVLIGTGLTAVDMVLKLRHQGHRGTIHLLSRHGLLPQAHNLNGTQRPSPFQEEGPQTARACLRAVRQAVEEAIAQGGDWQSVLDALRPDVQEVWRSLPRVEQRRLLRHVQPYWSIHRHRIAPQVAEHLNDLVRSRHLHIHAGRIQAFRPTADSVIVKFRPRHRSDTAQLHAAWVINCTGPESNYCRVSHPLIMELLHSGCGSPHPLGIGLQVGEDGALIDSRGTPAAHLYTLGSPRQGQLWETTSILEIRRQAQQLARTLLKRVSQRSEPLGLSPLSR